MMANWGEITSTAIGGEISPQANPFTYKAICRGYIYLDNWFLERAHLVWNGHVIVFSALKGGFFWKPTKNKDVFLRKKHDNQAVIS